MTLTLAWVMLTLAALGGLAGVAADLLDMRSLARLKSHKETKRVAWLLTAEKYLHKLALVIAVLIAAMLIMRG